ncbi:RecX family transcriptional regulator [bacterium]|nr:RecX family transcriptional regulator [bacterium]
MNLTSSDEVYSHALFILSRREHFTKELVQKLQKKDVSIDLIDEVILRLQKRDYLNDSRATEIFTLEFQRKKKGFIKLISELRIRGISGVESDIRALYTEESEQKNAEKILMLLHKPTREKIYRFLFNRGFSPEIIRRLMNKQIK